MDALFAALALVFVAELGDKTQLIVLGLGARHRLLPVIIGLTIGFGLSNLVASVVGGLLGATLPTRALAIAGGVLFLAFGAFGLRAALTGADDDDDDEEVADVAPTHIVRSVAMMILIGELGDKTQLTTATLAAQGSPALVWVGSTVGVVLASLAAVVIGRAIGSRMPERAVGIVSSLLFFVFGVVLLVTNI